MATVLPGTTIDVSKLTKSTSRQMFDGIFATGGITLSQVSVMTGVEPAAIQNWVKRKFVSSPLKRMYSQNQFARICIINMLRESLQLDRIIQLMQYINGSLFDESDDLIGDAELYHRYTYVLATLDSSNIDDLAINSAVELASADFVEPSEGAKQRLKTVLTVFAYAHFASLARKKAELMLNGLD